MTNNHTKLLLIVDPQIDFITGTLPVPDAEAAMNALAKYIGENGSGYDLICVTCDRHPLRHISFTNYGGQWPPHCIESSVGAAIWPPVMKALEKQSSPVHFLYKGEKQDKDEYSIFQSDKGAAEMKKYILHSEISCIDICGLAGDVCVANTLRDAIRLYPSLRFCVLERFTASLDGGSTLETLAIRR